MYKDKGTENSELTIQTDTEQYDSGNGEHITSSKVSQQIQLCHWPLLEKAVSKVLSPVGFEAHPFHIGWYNELVGPRFQLDYPEKTLALVLISGPDTFEKCIIPFVKAQPKDDLQYPKFDALDGSMKHVFKALSEELFKCNFEVDSIHDFEMHPSRKPKVLVQTAAHVSGAAEYFHRDRVNNKSPLWLKDSKLFGVAIHPAHGGWFAIRGVFIFKKLVDGDDLLKRPARPLPNTDEAIISHLLEEFAINWKSHVWRDLLPRTSSRKYSQYFIGYLNTEPEKRWDYIKSLPCFNDTGDQEISNQDRLV